MRTSPKPYNTPFPASAGIAIGPILFVIALLGILAAAASSGFGDFGTASVADRVTPDITTQANLIRAKINECKLIRGTNSNYDGYPSSDPINGTPVSDVECSGDPTGQKNIWSGSRVAHLPTPTTGFGPWYYINTNASGLGGSASNGRCIWTQPTVSNPADNAGIVQGLTKAASKFTNATSYSATAEVIYDPASTSQKFIVWITMPTGSPDAHCLP